MVDTTRFRVLNQEFNNFVTLLNERIKFLPNHEKKLAYDWSSRLKAHGGKTVEDFKFRNLIYSALLRNVRNQEMVAPFNRPPTFSRLEELREYTVSYWILFHDPFLINKIFYRAYLKLTMEANHNIRFQ